MKKDYQKRKRQNLTEFFYDFRREIIEMLMLAVVGLGIFLITGGRGILWIWIPVFLMYGIYRWMRLQEKKKIRLYIELENFAENFQMYYGYYDDVKEAVYDAMINSGREGYEFGKRMEKYLENPLDADSMEYAEPREYQLLETGLCAMNQEVSKIHIRESIRRFKEEIREEIFKMEETGHRFSGLAEVCLFPALTTSLIQSWATEYLQELNGYYEGIQGILANVLVLVITCAMFIIVNGLRFDIRIKQKKERESTGEILRFHNWILLQVNNKEACVESLLVGFLCLAGDLKKKVERLHYDYMEKGSRAIAKAREEETCMPYIRILEGLMLCDRVSVETAFSGMETERNFLMEKMKNENRKRIREKAAVAKVTALIPLYCVSLFFLILPFVTEGLSRLQAYTESFGTLLY